VHVHEDILKFPSTIRRGLEVGYFAGASSSDDVAVFDGSFDDHDCVVEGTFYFGDELFGATS
jgi:hypothetical protein